jgi:hypothetical protein
MPVPANPKIYHIVHVDKLPAIIASGGLLSDARLQALAPAGTNIGAPEIKARRLRMPVECHPDSSVGEYVPFYLCSRSYMLYVIYMANHAALTYRGGQGPIVHLEADLRTVVDLANKAGRRWALTLGNAATYATEFRNNIDALEEINWTAVNARDFREPAIKDGKQSEFLVHDSFPWSLVERIGVRDHAIAARVGEALHTATHRPAVEVRPDWYY